MSAKADRSKLARQAVARSFDEHSLVRITRTAKHLEPTDGVVVASGIRWVIVNRLSPDLDLDGYTAVRWKQVRKAQTFDPGCLPARAAARSAAQPVPSGVADATTTGSLLRTIEATFTPVAVHAECSKPPWSTVGAIQGIVAKSVLLVPVLPLDRPAPPIEMPFDHITRVDFGTRYLAALDRASSGALDR